MTTPKFDDPEAVAKAIEAVYDDAIKENFVRAARLCEDATKSLGTMTGGDPPWVKKWREDAFPIIFRGLLNRDARFKFRVAGTDQMW